MTKYLFYNKMNGILSKNINIKSTKSHFKYSEVF